MPQDLDQRHDLAPAQLDGLVRFVEYLVRRLADSENVARWRATECNKLLQENRDLKRANHDLDKSTRERLDLSSRGNHNYPRIY
jgi:hypothetical protein